MYVNKNYFPFKEEKREVPSILRKILAIDAYLTNVFVNWTDQFLFLRQFKRHHKFLEVGIIIFFHLKSNIIAYISFSIYLLFRYLVMV
jgi:hypothetical protein